MWGGLMADIIDIQIGELIRKIKQNIQKINELEYKINVLQGILDTIKKTEGE